MTEPISWLEEHRQTLDQLHLALQPYQREILRRLPPLMLQISTAMTELARTIARSPGWLEIGRFARRLALAEALAAANRPDGRPRRSGHRHRGTRAWARRHG